MASDEVNPGVNPGLPDEKNNSAARSATDQPSLVNRVKALAEALKGSDVSELDLTEDGARILIRRQVEASVTRPRGHARGQTGAGRGRQAESAAAPPPELGIAILAPLTGVFYASPSPSSPPFVQVGETVQAGQIVCLVEAMKVFNEVKSEIAGTVATIVAQSGQLVQKGEALIRVKPI